MKKSDRELVRQKFGGRCAYCGCVLPERWHVDHFDPVLRTSRLERDPQNRWISKAGPMSRPENHRIDNLMPSCPRCNLDKHSLTIEQWREFIAAHLRSLNTRHVPFNICKTFGLIKETGAKVVFYFEEYANA